GIPKGWPPVKGWWLRRSEFGPPYPLVDTVYLQPVSVLVAPSHMPLDSRPELHVAPPPRRRGEAWQRPRLALEAAASTRLVRRRGCEARRSRNSVRVQRCSVNPLHR